MSIRMPKPGQRQDGIRTLGDLQLRCVRDPMSGCLIWRTRPGSKRAPAAWIPGHGVQSLSGALYLLVHGEPAGDRRYVPICGNPACCELGHRRIGTIGEFQKAIKPTLSPEVRARVSRAAHALRHPSYSPEVAVMIRTSQESGAAIARRLGMHKTTVSAIRRGLRWVDEAPGASVFSWAAAA